MKPLFLPFISALVSMPAWALPVAVDPAGTLANPWTTEWNTDGNLESWTATNATVSVLGGTLQGVATSTDSGVLRSAITAGPDLDLGFNDFLELRVQVPGAYTGAIQISYGTTMTTGFSAGRVITIPAVSIPKDGAFHVYRIDVGLEMYWRSTLRDLRVDAVDGSGSTGMVFAIDYVKIGDEPDAVVYQPRYTVSDPAAGGTNELGRTVIAMESKHFRFQWDATVATHSFWTAGMPHGTLRNLEEAWQLYVKQLGYREPCESWTASRRNGTQYKVNVSSWHSGYWAGGDSGDFGRLNITPDGLRVDPPTGVIPHELMHVFQMHNTSQYVPGAWWECHANYGRERWLQHYGLLFPANQRSGIDPTFLRCAHQMLGHGRDYYLSWPFFMYVDENPDGLSDLGDGTIAKVWQQTQNGEYSMMTLDRITPTTSLKDISGNYARRGATYNYSHKTDIQAALSAFGQPLDNAATARWQFTDLVQRPDNPAVWRVPYEMAPMQGAYAIHELVPTGSGAGRVVTVNLHGLADSARAADWRASFIVISDTGAERYSTLWNSGANSVTLAANENRVYLSVAGTPDVFYDGGFDDALVPYRSHRSKARFPYEIQLTGATPKQRDNGATTGLVQHANGGGYKASTATVDATAYIGPNARVLGTARVRNTARIEDYAVVSGSAQVLNSAVVSGHALVRGAAIVRDNAKVRDWALVEGGTVSLTARVLEHGNIKGGTVTDLATAKGTAASLSGTLSGNAMIDGDYSDFFYGRDIANGITFGHQPYIGTPDSSIRPLPDGLYASYNFATAHDSRILDAYGVTDGFTQGSPAWVAADAKRKGFLSFNSAGQSVILDRSVADLHDFTFTAWVKPVATTANQTVLWLGATPTRRLFFTPKDGTGKARFSIVNGGAEQSLTAPTALPPGVWSHIAITLDGTTGVLYLNGAVVASGAITLRPEQLLAANTATGLQHNYLGRSEGTVMPRFNGAVDEVQFFGKALAASQVADMQPPTDLATAGTLYVDLKASDASAGSATWVNTGTIGDFTRTNTPTKVANVLGTGVPGVQFNGTNQAYTGPNSVADLDGASDRSIEVWACNPGLATEETTVSWGHRSTVRRDMAFNFGNSSSFGAVTHWGDDMGWGTPPSAGAWHYLVYTYDGGTTAKVYVDGEIATTRTLGGALDTFASEALNIGCQRSTANGTRANYFSGYINRVRIHGGVLTAAQIAANYGFGPSLAAGATGNQPPSLAAVANQSTTPVAPPVTVAVTLSDSDTPLAAVTLTGSSDNPGLIDENGITITGEGPARTMTITPRPNQFGTTTISLLASDGVGTASQMFQFTVAGPLDAWRLVWFGTTENSGNAADDADPDGDGQSNLHEYLAGTVPNNPTDRIVMALVPGSRGTFTVTGKADRIYGLQRNSGLDAEGWRNLASRGPLAADQQIELVDPEPPADHAFYRLTVNWPGFSQ